MTALDLVRVIPRQRRSDARGWLLKVLSGDEPELSQRLGEVYLVQAAPGEVRGNHYHRRTSEWFTLVQGTAELALRDEGSGARRVLRLSAKEPVTVHVPAGISHAFRAEAGAREGMLLVAYADERYDPADIFPVSLFDEER